MRGNRNDEAGAQLGNLTFADEEVRPFLLFSH